MEVKEFANLSNRMARRVAWSRQESGERRGGFTGGIHPQGGNQVSRKYREVINSRGELKIMANSNSSSGGVGVFGLLGVAFVVLKLTGVINWSWWLVTLPFWGGLVIVVVVLAIAFLLHLKWG